MTPRLGGLGLAVAALGALWFVAPSAGSAPMLAIPSVASEPAAPVPDESTTTEPTPVDTSSSSSSTSTSTSTTTTTSSSTTTSILLASIAAPPFPVSVSARSSMVGPGGSMTFTGTCPASGPLGPIEVWITRPGDDTTETVVTDLVGPTWTYWWAAPTELDRFGTREFRFWCGEPIGTTSTYPPELVVVVDMVMVGEPPTTTTTTTTVVAQSPVDVVLPETG